MERVDEILCADNIKEELYNFVRILLILSQHGMQICDFVNENKRSKNRYVANAFFEIEKLLSIEIISCRYYAKI